MSLTKLLHSKDGKEIKACLGNLKSHLIIDSPEGLKWGAMPIVTSSRSEGWYASLVGIAWDYWIRLWLLQRHKSSEGPLVAENTLAEFTVGKFSVNLLIEDDEYIERISDLTKRQRMYSYREEYIASIKELCEASNSEEYLKAQELKQKFDNVKARRRAVICSDIDIFDNKIFDDVVFLAGLEQAYRSHTKWKKPDNEVSQLIAGEVQALANVWMRDSERFGPASQPVWTNPSFGGASAFVGGADADVVVGNTLWDFKTTKHFKYQNEDWAQLLGYVILSEWGKSPFNIKRIGLYLARFGSLVYIDMNALKELIDLGNFKQKLLMAANQRATKITSLLGGGFRNREIKKFKLEFIENEIMECSDFKNSATQKARILFVMEFLKNHDLTKELEMTKKEITEYTKTLWDNAHTGNKKGQ